MKNIKIILSLVIGIVIGGAIGIKASQLIESSQVVYKDNQTVDVALDNLFDELNLGKDKIAEAITNKGVETTNNNTLEEMANNIDNISFGGNIESLLQTVLWQNPNQAATSFPPQTVTFNDDYTNYDYLVIKYYRALSTNMDKAFYNILPTDVFPGSWIAGFGFSSGYNSAIKITEAGVITLWASGPTGSGGTSYIYAIPLAIYGCNLK